jgi:hypothetical protein
MDIGYDIILLEGSGRGRAHIKVIEEGAWCI